MATRHQRSTLLSLRTRRGVAQADFGLSRDSWSLNSYNDSIINWNK